MNKLFRISLFSFFCMFFLVCSAFADVPKSLSFQGRITDNSGVPITDDNASFKFGFYTAAEHGTKIGSDIYENNKRVDNGIYSVNIPVDNTILAALNQPLYIQVEYQGQNDSGYTSFGRTQLTSSPYALSVASGAVKTEQIADGSITPQKMKASGTFEIYVASAAYAMGSNPSGIPDYSIAAVKLASSSVTEVKINAGAVTADKIGTNAVTEAKINASAVTVGKIGTGAVTADKIGTNAVTEVKISSLNVTTSRIANGAVTDAKIASGINGYKLVNNSTATAYSIYVARAQAADSVSGLGTGVVASSNIATNAVTEVKISSLNVTTSRIANSAVTDAKIASGINGYKLVNNSTATAYGIYVARAQAADSVSGLGTGVVASSNIATNAVTEVKISSLNVTTSRIANGAVTDAKIASGINGYKLVNNSTATAYGIYVARAAALDTGVNINANTINAVDIVYTGTLNGVSADLAEIYPSNDILNPGDVVIISETRDGYIEKSKTANDTKVAGVISTEPGIVLNSSEKGYKLALVGKVPVNVTNEGGDIKRGDLLVASSTPGYAMKAVDPKPGTVIGKALENYTGSRGKILALVNLQ